MLKDTQDPYVESDAFDDSSIESGHNGQPLDFGQSDYARMQEILAKLQKEEDEARKAKLEEELEEMRKKAAERAEQFSVEMKHFLAMMAQFAGEQAPQGCEDALSAVMFEKLNGQNEFFSRLKDEGRSPVFKGASGQVELHYAQGGHLLVTPGQGGQVNIALKGKKITEEMAEDIINLHKARNAGPLTIGGPKKQAQILWRTAKLHGLATADGAEYAYKPSKNDLKWLEQLQAEREFHNAQQQAAEAEHKTLSENGLLTLVSSIHEGYQGVDKGYDPAHVMMSEPGDELYETKAALSGYGRLLNAIGYEPQIDGTVSIKETTLDDKQIKKVQELVDKGFTSQNLEKAIKIANPDGRQLKSLFEDQLLPMQQHRIQEMEKKAVLSQSRFGRIKLRAAGIGKQEQQDINAFLEDTRDKKMSRFQVKPPAPKPETPAEKAAKSGSKIAAGKHVDTPKPKSPKPKDPAQDNKGPSASKPSAPKPPAPSMGGKKG